MAQCKLWLNTTRMRDRIHSTSAYGYAMLSIGLGEGYSTCVSGLQTGPICVFAQGRSVPISRGSPPAS